MIVAFDNSFFTLVINPNAPPRAIPGTDKPVAHCRQRIEALIDRLSKEAERVIVPSPVLAEVLCASEDIEKILTIIDGYKALDVVEFGSRAAIELAIMTRVALDGGDKKDGSTETWHRVKYDRQIVATAKAHGATVIYTDDDSQTYFAERNELKVVHTWELDLPPEYAQTSFLDDDQEQT